MQTPLPLFWSEEKQFNISPLSFLFIVNHIFLLHLISCVCFFNFSSKTKCKGPVLFHLFLRQYQFLPYLTVGRKGGWFWFFLGFDLHLGEPTALIRLSSPTSLLSFEEFISPKIQFMKPFLHPKLCYNSIEKYHFYFVPVSCYHKHGLLYPFTT